jgi:predicted dehydrogenase
MTETENTVRVGVVGCGWWSTAAHLPGIAEHPQAELAAIADPNADNRERAAEAYAPGVSVESAERMFDLVELDAVVVATPAAEHFEPAAAALARGLNVLVEKPMTIDAVSARELVALADTASAELMVGYTWHFSPQVVRARDEISAGRIGRVEHVSSLFASIARDLYRGHPELLREELGYELTGPADSTYSDPRVAGGGQAQSQLTHNLALALHLTGLRPRLVTAVIESFELGVDLADAVALAFEGGAVGSIDSVGSVLPGQQEILQCRVFGTDGHLALDLIQGTGSIHGAAGETEVLTPAAFSPADREKVQNLVRYPEKEPVKNLVDVTLGRAENINPGALGLEVVEVIDAIYESARTGAAVDLAAIRQARSAPA